MPRWLVLSAFVVAALAAAAAGAGGMVAPAAGAARLSSAERHLLLAEGGVSRYVVALPASAGETESFAAAELVRYLERMSGARFALLRGPAPARAIVLRADTLPSEGYRIAVRGGQLLVSGDSPRALLFGVYAVLERLGCRWLAPDLPFYHGAAQVVPRRARLVYLDNGDVDAQPAFRYRKIDVENGRSHDVASLRRIIEWMPRLGYNTLQVPLDYAGHGRVVWDHWRQELTPELRRRGLLLEVGGHGYQNFLSAVRDSALFRQHPEWFGRDSSCRPTRDERTVFDTGNPDAVAHVVGAVAEYVRAHPEIDIFDFWPPDGARWAQCAAADSAGALSSPDRQAVLVSRLRDELKRVRPGLRLEIIAYGEMQEPPPHQRLPLDLLVDVCPINQSFDRNIHDAGSPRNAAYVRAIQAWRAAMPGEVGLYSYYRKYAWRSLPLVLPHYLQGDLRWFAAVPLQGISTYAEPADWGTYEVNHFMLGKLAWQADADVDRLLDDYGRARYGAAWPAARAALATLEDRYRLVASVPFSAPDPPDTLAAVRRELASRRAALHVPDGAAAANATGAALERLRLMLDYAIADLDVLRLRAAGGVPAQVQARVRQLVRLQEANAGRGVFLVAPGQLDVMTRHYDVESLR